MPGIGALMADWEKTPGKGPPEANLARAKSPIENDDQRAKAQLPVEQPHRIPKPAARLMPSDGRRAGPSHWAGLS